MSTALTRTGWTLTTTLVSPGRFTWIGATLLLDVWWGRKCPADLAERLQPYQPTSVADEAEGWLRQQT
jgi:hypothetical protein